MEDDDQPLPKRGLGDVPKDVARRWVALRVRKPAQAIARRYVRWKLNLDRKENA